MKKSALISFSTALLVPALALAQNFQPTYINQAIRQGQSWLQIALTVVMALMTLYFLIGVFRYISEKDAAKLKDRRTVMINGLIGLFVAVSVWGIIRIAGNIFGTNGYSAPVEMTCPPGTVAVGNQCV